MARLGRGVVGLVAGYIVGAIAGAALVSMLSGNTHDKSVEIATTSALVTGPIGALIGLAWGLLGGKR